MNGETDKQLQRKDRQKRALTLIIMAIAFAGGTPIIYNTPEVVFRINEHVVVYKHADSPAIFDIAAGIAAITAISLLAVGTRVLFGTSERHPVTTTPMPRSAWRLVWGMVNTGLLLLSVWSGYAALSSGRLKGTNPDPVLCIAAFIVVMLVAIAAPHFATVATFQRPQWGRFPLSWWHDPMQTLFVATCWWAGFLVGNLTRLISSNLSADKTVVWTVLTYVAILAGLLVGQGVDYVVYRDRIES